MGPNQSRRISGMHRDNLAENVDARDSDELEVMNLDGALRSEHVDLSLTGVVVAERGKHVCGGRGFTFLSHFTLAFAQLLQAIGALSMSMPRDAHKFWRRVGNPCRLNKK